MDVNIDTIKSLGSLLIYVAIIIAVARSVAKRKWGDAVIAIAIGGFVALMVNTPSNMLDIGQAIWDLTIGAIKEGSDSNVFTK